MPSRKISPPGGATRPSEGHPGAGGTTATPGPAAALKTAHSASVCSARLLACVGALSEIGEVWAPIGQWVEKARMAMVGEDGFTSDQLVILELYARRWSRLDPRLQRMFLEHADKDKCARIALFDMIVARHPRYYGNWLHRNLERLWIETHGYPPSIGLMPTWFVRQDEEGRRVK